MEKLTLVHPKQALALIEVGDIFSLNMEDLRLITLKSKGEGFCKYCYYDIEMKDFSEMYIMQTDESIFKRYKFILYKF